jgi:Virulence-associated protein E
MGGNHGLADAAVRVRIETRMKHELSFVNQIVIASPSLNVGTTLMEAIKAFMDPACRHFRPPCGQRHVKRARLCAGRHDEADVWIRDDRGARRFWPIRCGEIDVEPLRENRDQTMAEPGGSQISLYLRTRVSRLMRAVLRTRGNRTYSSTSLGSMTPQATSAHALPRRARLTSRKRISCFELRRTDPKLPTLNVWRRALELAGVFIDPNYGRSRTQARCAPQKCQGGQTAMTERIASSSIAGLLRRPADRRPPRSIPSRNSH